MRRQTRCTPPAIQGPPQILSEPQMQNPRGVGWVLGAWRSNGRCVRGAGEGHAAVRGNSAVFQVAE